MRGALGLIERVGVGASGAGVRVAPNNGVGVAPPNGVGRGVLVIVTENSGVSVGSVVNVGVMVGRSVGIIWAVVAVHPLMNKVASRNPNIEAKIAL